MGQNQLKTQITKINSNLIIPIKKKNTAQEEMENQDRPYQDTK